MEANHAVGRGCGIDLDEDGLDVIYDHHAVGIGIADFGIEDFNEWAIRDNGAADSRNGIITGVYKSQSESNGLTGSGDAVAVSDGSFIVVIVNQNRCRDKSSGAIDGNIYLCRFAIVFANRHRCVSGDEIFGKLENEQTCFVGITAGENTRSHRNGDSCTCNRLVILIGHQNIHKRETDGDGGICCDCQCIGNADKYFNGRITHKVTPTGKLIDA